MDTGDGKGSQGQILAELKILNAQIATQNSMGRILFMGIVYGIGFFVGSAVIATIALGILGPIFGHIPWVRDAFTTGLSLLR